MDGTLHSVAQQHRTVSRVLRILEAIATAGDDGITLARLAIELESPKTSIFAAVKGLVSEGYVTEVQGRYFLGPALGALMPSGSQALGRYALPLMREIRDETNETVTLAVRVGDSVVYTDSVQSSNIICYSAPLQTRRPLWPTSSGKIFLAAEPDPAGTLARLAELQGPQSIPSINARCLPELAEVSRTGMAFNRGETVEDVGAVAVGLRQGGRLVAAIAVAGPTGRVSSRLTEFGELVIGKLSCRADQSAVSDADPDSLGA